MFGTISAGDTPWESTFKGKRHLYQGSITVTKAKSKR